METKGFFIIVDHRLHLQISLVTDDVVDFVEFDVRQHTVENFLVVVNLIAWQEFALVVDILDESVSSVSIGANGCHDNSTVIVRYLRRREHSSSPVSH